MHTLTQTPILLRHIVRTVLLGLTIATTLCPATASSLAEPCPPPAPCCAQRPQDQVWLVSWRELGDCAAANLAPNLSAWRYDEATCWQCAELSELIAAGGPDVCTVIYVHGNRIDVATARSQGLSLYRALAARSCDPRPLRLVVWSWPSERMIRGPKRDARLKAERSEVEGYYLGWLIDQFDAQEPVSLVGYSFGARVVTGALHLLGGGTVAGQELHARLNPVRSPLRAALMAAAVDCHWLWPGMRHGAALSQLETLFLVNNSCDRVLRRFPKLACDRHGAAALGVTGLATGRLEPDDQAKVEQVDACCYVGPAHDFDRYVSSGPIMDAIYAAVCDDFVAAAK